MRFKKSDVALEVYGESKSRRMYVGLLKWNRDTNIFEFTYDRNYIMSPKAIPVGPDLPLSKRNHTCKGKLFPSFQDRIPSKGNPAYVDYCNAAGISPKERNPIILLGAIGKRGPSTFVFEPITINTVDGRNELENFRKAKKISLHEIALALDLNEVTLHRILKGTSSDNCTLTLLSLYLTVLPALKVKLGENSRKIHKNTLVAIIDYCTQRNSELSDQ